jgi:hypothetical protein
VTLRGKSFFSRNVTDLFSDQARLDPSAKGLDVPRYEPAKFALGLAAQLVDAIAGDDQASPSLPLAGQLQGDERGCVGQPIGLGLQHVADRDLAPPSDAWLGQIADRQRQIVEQLEARPLVDARGRRLRVCFSA